jgi:putative acetyltransferase
MNVRDEQDGDHAAVGALQSAAFATHPEQVADLVDDLRQIVLRGDGLSLVAETDGQIVAHLMFTQSLLDAPRELVPVQVLSPVGVLPAHQGRGIGSALIRQGLELLATRTWPLVFLEGSPVYYSRFGFLPGAELGFRKPSLRIPEAGFQAFKLPAYEEWMTGTLVYDHAFWRNDCVGLRGARLEEVSDTFKGV